MVVNLLSSKASAQKNTVTGFLDICLDCLMSLESHCKKQTFLSNAMMEIEILRVRN